MSKSTISAMQLFQLFPDQESARDYLEARRWPVGVICPVCKGHQNKTARKNGFYRCNPCQEDFTIRTGTIIRRLSGNSGLHRFAASTHGAARKWQFIAFRQRSPPIGPSHAVFACDRSRPRNQADRMEVPGGRAV